MLVGVWVPQMGRLLNECLVGFHGARGSEDEQLYKINWSLLHVKVLSVWAALHMDPICGNLGAGFSAPLAYVSERGNSIYKVLYLFVIFLFLSAALFILTFEIVFSLGCSDLFSANDFCQYAVKHFTNVQFRWVILVFQRSITISFAQSVYCEFAGENAFSGRRPLQARPSPATTSQTAQRCSAPLRRSGRATSPKWHPSEHRRWTSQSQSKPAADSDAFTQIFNSSCHQGKGGFFVFPCLSFWVLNGSKAIPWVETNKGMFRSEMTTTERKIFLLLWHQKICKRTRSEAFSWDRLCQRFHLCHTYGTSRYH